MPPRATINLLISKNSQTLYPSLSFWLFLLPSLSPFFTFFLLSFNLSLAFSFFHFTFDYLLYAKYCESEVLKTKLLSSSVWCVSVHICVGLYTGMLREGVDLTFGKSDKNNYL
jgi:succinate dehydrogenase/fumarate reductase cytochrome b subunit